MISKNILKEVLLEQKQKLESLNQEDFIIREMLIEIEKFVNIKHSIVISGIRRCGKSVLIFEIIKRFFKDNYYFINFQDERLADFTVQDFNVLYETLIELFGKQKTFFLDEIQNVEGWEKWVRRMYDDGFKFFLTGSNAKLLSKELATLLTGRHLQFSVYPFSFKEFLKFRNIKYNKEDIYITEKKAFLIRHFNEYVDVGGFPEYLNDKKIEILQGYFNDILYHDVAERHKIEQLKELKVLARYIIANSGNLMSYRQLSAASQIKSVNTVIKYFSAIENSYLIFAVPYFSYSLKKQNMNPFKVYAIDISFKDAINFKFSKDIGRKYENIVALQLKRDDIEFYYWKNVKHEEVDFIIMDKNKIKCLIQVCYDISFKEAKEREIKSLLNASKELKCKNLIIITDNYDAEETIVDEKIRYVPLWKWLLDF